VLQPWFETRLDTIAAAAGQDARTAVGEQKEKAIVQLMGIEYVQEWQGKEEANVHRFMAKKDRLLEITGYNRMLRTVALGESEPTAKSFALPDGEVRLGLSNSFLTVALSPVGGTGDSAALPLAPLAVRLLREYSNPYEIPVEALVLEGFGGTMRVRACLTLLVVRAEGDSTSIQRIESDVLIGPR
jgi:hypothetical protein